MTARVPATAIWIVVRTYGGIVARSSGPPRPRVVEASALTGIEPGRKPLNSCDGGAELVRAGGGDLVVGDRPVEAVAGLARTAPRTRPDGRPSTAVRALAGGAPRRAATAPDTADRSAASTAANSRAAARRTSASAPVVASAAAKRAQLDSASSASKSRWASTAAVRGRESASWASIMSVDSLSRTSCRRSRSRTPAARRRRPRRAPPRSSARSRRARTPRTGACAPASVSGCGRKNAKRTSSEATTPIARSAASQPTSRRPICACRKKPRNAPLKATIPHGEAARWPPAHVDGDRHDDDEEDQGEDAVRADEQAQRDRRDHRQRKHQRGQDLPAGGAVLHGEARHHGDHPGEQHRDDQQRTVGRRDHGRRRAAGRQLQGAGHVDERVDQRDGDGDATHRLQPQAQLAEPGVGAGQPIGGVAPPGPRRPRRRLLDDDVVRQCGDPAPGTVPRVDAMSL